MSKRRAYQAYASQPYPGQFDRASWGAVLLECGWSPVHNLDKATIAWMQRHWRGER